MPKTCFFLPEQCHSCPNLFSFINYVSFILFSLYHSLMVLYQLSWYNFTTYPLTFIFLLQNSTSFPPFSFFPYPPVLYHDILPFCICFCISSVKTLLFVTKPSVGRVSQLLCREFSLFHFFFSHRAQLYTFTTVLRNSLSSLIFIC